MTCRISPGGHFTRRSEGRLFRRLRDPEIIDGVRRGEADIGFLGSDKFEEWEPEVSIEWVGNVQDCKFVLAARLGSIATVEKRLERVESVSVATSYPRWLGKLAAANCWRLDIREVSGSAEAFGDITDMVADLSVSGQSLIDNGLHKFYSLAGVQLGLIYRQDAP